jgi:hypothetical protein
MNAVVIKNANVLYINVYIIGYIAQLGLKKPWLVMFYIRKSDNPNLESLVFWPPFPRH